MKTEKQKSSREYPPIYEKSVPVLVGILIFLVLALLVAAAGVLLGALG